MRVGAKDVLISLFMGLALPGIMLNFGAALLEQRALPVPETREEELPASVAMDMKLRHGDGTFTAMDMDDYLAGVLLAEMPAWFEKEALKAQAVVARTYAAKAGVTGGKHGNGSVCTEPSCCQGYLTPETYCEGGGSDEDVLKVRSAVRSTSGQVLVYEGELIEATYFSCSGGRTEDASAVWGREFTYLQAVESPGEENAAHYRDTAEFSREELEKALDITLTGDSSDWFGETAFTEGGGVDTIRMGEAMFTGLELRQRLGLRSTAFSVEAGDSSLLFTTKGYGHRVGMSQYGADAMAVSGAAFEDILSHYYQGSELVRWEGES